MWILGTATTLPSLTGLSQFKDKSKSLKAVPVGLATYPLLQAADVLGYHPSHVLVGFDQNCSNAHWKLFGLFIFHYPKIFRVFSDTLSNCRNEDYNRRILKIVDLHSISTGFVPSKKITLYGEFAGISTDQVVEDCSGLNYTLV
uniref:Uncharacterized protein n=1 Tax=Meloidogyne enterolobii TaxID=390850 RepID=A0A6V7TUM1_MELEN|nr:unnamed protein product [Meloidogyne enterolobii]